MGAGRGFRGQGAGFPGSEGGASGVMGGVSRDEGAGAWLPWSGAGLPGARGGAERGAWGGVSGEGRGFRGGAGLRGERGGGASSVPGPAPADASLPAPRLRPRLGGPKDADVITELLRSRRDPVAQAGLEEKKRSPGSNPRPSLAAAALSQSPAPIHPSANRRHGRRARLHMQMNAPGAGRGVFFVLF